MLVLTRFIDESVIIGPDITIRILSIKGMQVRLGITAPRDVTVHRKEVVDRIARGQTNHRRGKTGTGTDAGAPGVGDGAPDQMAPDRQARSDAQGGGAAGEARRD
jgi:carbon storage regulator